MDFHSMKRRDLQALCKMNNIPANLTNAAMADNLASLDSVEGIEEFLGQSECGGSESPERFVITSPNVPRTSTRQKATKEELECSKMTTRTRCGTRRRAVEGTGTAKTTATRTTRRKAPQESASIEREMDKGLQEEFESSLDQSEVSENYGLTPGGGESVETSEVSAVSVDQNEHDSAEGQKESESKVSEVDDLQKPFTVDEEKETLEDEEGSTEMVNGNQKVDFHSLTRKELQNLCKKNKIPANVSNAAMADNLASLENVEGLDDLLTECDPLAAKSPEMSRMTSSRARQTRTTQKSTRRKPAQAGSALGKMESVQKEVSVMQSLVRKMDLNMEGGECPVSKSEEVKDKDVPGQLEACPEESEVPDFVSEDNGGFNGQSKLTSEEVSDESENAIVVESEKDFQDEGFKNNSDMEEARKELDQVAENNCGGVKEEDSKTEVSNDSGESVQGVSSISVSDEDGKDAEADSDDSSIAESDDDETEAEIIFASDDDGKEAEADSDDSSIAESDDDETEAEAESNSSSISESLESSTLSLNESNVGIGLTQEGPVGNEGLVASETDEIFTDLPEDDDFYSEDDEEKGVDEADVDDVDVNVSEDSIEDFSNMVNTEKGLEPEANCATHEDMKIVSDSVLGFSKEDYESSSVEVNVDSESENGLAEVEKLDTSVPDASACEKLEGSQVKDPMNKMSDSELATQADQHAPKIKGTPLCHKSLRKLKRMLKEKLQETHVLASKMEKLTLEERVILPGSDNPEVELAKGVDEDLKEGFQAMEEPLVVPEVGEDEDVTLHAEQKDVSMFIDNEISVDSITGHINVESIHGGDASELDKTAPEEPKQQMTNTKQSELVIATDLDNIASCPPVTPGKSARKTPKKPLLFTPSKTTMSAGKTNHALDIINKENIDNSAAKTGPGKIEIGSGKIFSAMSMQKLKKEFKVLQQQSEKKRPALQSRSENCPLASP